MTKLKTWVDLARSLDADWAPRQTTTITDLIAEARAVDWDFTNQQGSSPGSAGEAAKV